MAVYCKSVVATAIAEIGYKETGTNKNKYAAYIDKNYPDFYNSKKNGVAWCDIFVDYCVLVNSSSEDEALYALCQPKKSAGAGCKYSYDYYKAKKRTGKEAKIGAQIFFGKDTPTHTGIVVDVNNDSVITVEGNSDNQVKKHTYKKNSTKIFGYGYPRYTEVQEEPKEDLSEKEPVKPIKSIEEVALEVINGVWGNGEDRKAKLTEAGYDYSAVQSKVNDLLGKNKPKSNIYVVKTFTPGKSLNLRSRPKIDPKNIITSIKDGSEIEVISISDDGWAKCNYKGKTVYCTANRLKKK